MLKKYYFVPDDPAYVLPAPWALTDSDISYLLNGKTSSGGLWVALAAGGAAVLAAVAVLVGRKRASR